MDHDVTVPIRRQRLWFPQVPDEIGRYELTEYRIWDGQERRTLFYNTLQDDGDVLGDRYFLHEGAGDNFGSVTSYDATSGAISGEFELTLVIDTTNREKVYPAWPDTIRFTEGRFETRVWDADELREEIDRRRGR